MSGMQLGVCLYPYSQFDDLADLAAFTKLSDSLGYDFALIPDHTIFGIAQEQSLGAIWWDPVVVATHLASVTTRIRLAFSVLVLPHHHPLHLAKALATLDHVSNGRVDVGLGVGWLREEFESLGIPFAQRGARTDEYIDVLRTVWTTHPCTFHGRHFDFEEQSFFPKPRQTPHPPIWVGGTLQASVERVALRGDGWQPMTVSLDELESGIALLRERLRAQGREASSVAIAGKVPLWEASQRTTDHALEAGASPHGYFDGDLGAARDHIARGEELGISRMWVELPLDSDRRTRELTRFAEHFL